MTVTLRISWRALFEQIPLNGICSIFTLSLPIKIVKHSMDNLFRNFVVDRSTMIS